MSVLFRLQNHKMKKIKKNLKILSTFFLSLAYVFAIPIFAYAQTAEEKARCEKFASYFTVLTDGLPKFCSLSQLLTFVLERLLWLSGSVSVLFIIVGGFFYLSAAGNEEQSEKGKKILMNSIVGLIIIVMATAIVRIVSGTLKGG